MAASQDRRRAVWLNSILSETKRKRITPTLVHPPQYVFKTFDDVYSEEDYNTVLQAYEAVLRELPPDVVTRPDASVIEREGRIDAALPNTDRVAVSESITDFVKAHIGTPAQQANNVRALIVRGPVPNQAWHMDNETVGTSPMYATLLVALGDVEEDMGPTEFTVTDASPPTGLLTNAQITDENTIVRLMLRKNQGLLFDGRIRHRGTSSARARVPVVYHVFKRDNMVDPNL